MVSPDPCGPDGSLSLAYEALVQTATLHMVYTATQALLVYLPLGPIDKMALFAGVSTSGPGELLPEPLLSAVAPDLA